MDPEILISVCLREQMTVKSLKVEAEAYEQGRAVGVYAHFQHQDVTGGGLEGIKEANKQWVLEVLQDSKLMGDLVTLHQLLVHKLSGHCSFGSFLITFFNDRESAPGKQVEKVTFRGL